MQNLLARELLEFTDAQYLTKLGYWILHAKYYNII